MKVRFVVNGKTIQLMNIEDTEELIVNLITIPMGPVFDSEVDLSELQEGSKGTFDL